MRLISLINAGCFKGANAYLNLELQKIPFRINSCYQ